MIFGVGTDVVQRPRIEKLLRDHGARFINRVLAPTERDALPPEGPQLARHMASRFALKEACLKALGTGVSGGITLRDVVVSKDLRGKPLITLTGAAAAYLLPKGAAFRIEASVSDDPPVTIAVVVVWEI